MDLWDVVRLMLRRWVVAVPMLILTFAGTVWVAKTVQPDYTAEGNVSLLPPSVEESVAAGKSRKVNPWDTDSLTGAIAVKLRSKAMHDALKADGYAGEFEADRDLQFPSVVTVKVTAPSETAAQATVKELLQRVADQVKQQQSQYGLKPGEEITTTIIDDGSNVQAATGKVKRALIVVFGIGVILTMTLTICVDVLLRWRARRRAAAQERLAAQALKLPTLAPVANVQAPNTSTANGSSDETWPIGVSLRYREPNKSSTPPVSPVSPAKPAAQSRSGTVSAPATGPAPTAKAAPAKSGAPKANASAEATQQIVVEPSPEATQRIPTRLEPRAEPRMESRMEPIADDATIILPLSNAPWAGKKSQSSDSGKEVKPR